MFWACGSQRTVRTQAGIKLEVVQQGELGKFSLQALFLQLSTSVAMFALATLVVDFLATRYEPPLLTPVWRQLEATHVHVVVAVCSSCLQHHKAYKRAKTEEYQFGPAGKVLYLVERGVDGSRVLSDRKSVSRRRQSGRRSQRSRSGGSPLSVQDF